MKDCDCVNCECQKCNSDEVPYEGAWACDEKCNTGSEMNECCGN